MRVAVVVIAVGIALSAASVAPASGEARQPTLRIVDSAPLTVRGTSFKAGERIKLLVNAGKPATKAVRAGPRGGFTVRLGISTNIGTAVVVQAIGARGSRAMVDVTTPHGSRPGCDELL